MIIRHMQGTFGTLDGEQLRLDTGLNIIYAPNESGKSTWCAFLRAMLYGIDTSQRARAGFVPDKQKYAPWSGKPMAGELELEQDGKRITIRRWTEAKSAPMRAFSAVYTGTDIPVPGLTATDAGEQLTGVSAEVFQRSAFIGQGGLVVTGTPELERRISAIVTSGEEASSYTEADAQLRAWLRRRRSGQHGALPELEQRIADTETQLHRLERNAQEQAACAAELRETEAELQTVTDQMNAARQRQYAALALAIETLGRADAELQSRFSPQLAQKAADYMDYLTSGRYDELVLARDLSAKARSADDPTPRDTAYLSAGTADLLYLSVRLALCELTCPTDDPCPLVLDDTLVNFDDARARRAMALFREIAQHRQVILFTCHERDCPAREQ